MPPKAAEKKPTTAGKAPAGKAPEKKVCLLLFFALFTFFFLSYFSFPDPNSWFFTLSFDAIWIFILTRFVTPLLGSRKEDRCRWWREEKAHQDQKGDLLFLHLQGFVQSESIGSIHDWDLTRLFFLQFWSRFTLTPVSPTVPCLSWTLLSMVCFFPPKFRILFSNWLYGF